MWKCKKCGEEIVADVIIEEELSFHLDKQKELDKLAFLSETSIDDMVKKCPGYYIRAFRCDCCGEEGDELEDIAVWRD